MNKFFLAISFAAYICSTNAVEWRDLDESKWYSGPKITSADLAGKVVLIDEWGVNCPPCRALLPRMQHLWNSFKSKPFVLIGSHRQGHQPEKVAELVKQHKLTYPMYDGAGLAKGEPGNGGGIPFLYVVNPSGKVVYAGRDEKAATEALVTAISSIGMLPSLMDGVIIDKKSPYKPLEKQLVLGKRISSIQKKLQADIAKAEKSSATAKQKEMAAEAQSLLNAIDAAKQEIKESLDQMIESDPEEALKVIKPFMVTFPEYAAEYKPRLGEIAQKAKEFKLAKKQREAEEKKAAKK